MDPPQPTTYPEDDNAYEYTLRCALLFDQKHNPITARPSQNNRYSMATMQRRQSKIMSGLSSINSRFKAPEKYAEIPKALLKGLEQRIHQILTDSSGAYAFPSSSSSAAAAPKPTLLAPPLTPGGSLPVRRRSSRNRQSMLSAPDFSKNCLALFLKDMNVKTFRDNLALNGKVDDLLRLYSQIVKRMYRQHWKSQQAISTTSTPHSPLLLDPAALTSGLDSPPDEKTPDAQNKEMISFVNAQLERELTNFIAIIRMTISAVCPDHPSSPAILERLGDLTDLNLFDVPESLDARLYRRLGPLASRVIIIFQTPPELHQAYINATIPLCTEENAGNDLRLLLDLLNQGIVYGYKPSDFLDEDGRTRLMDQENLEISRILEGMRYRNYNYSTVRKTEFDLTRKNDLVFVPRSPRSCYQVLLGRCIYRDVCVAFEKPEPPAEKPTLSEASLLLLNQCAKFWRVPQQAHEIIQLDVIKTMVFRREIPQPYLLEALDNMERAYESPKNIWTQQDLNLCLTIFTEIQTWVIEDFALTVMHMEMSQKTASVFAVDLLVQLVNSAVFQRVMLDRIPAMYGDMVQTIQSAAVQRYQKLHEVAEAAYPDSEILPLTYLSTLVEQDSRHIGRLLPKIALSPNYVIHVAAFALESELKCLKLEVQNIINTPRDGEVDLANALDIYEVIYDLNEHAINIAGVPLLRDELPIWLKKHLFRWMAQIESDIPTWITNAINIETTQYEGERFPYSSSVIDVSAIFFQQIELIRKITWPDAAVEEEIMKRFAKIMLDMLNIYRESVEKKFMETLAMMALGGTKSFADRSSMFLRSMGVIITQGAENSQPVYFSIESCTALNNLHMIEERVNQMYDALGVETHLGRIERPPTSSAAPPAEVDTFLVSFHVLHAESLSLDKANPRPFIEFTNMGTKRKLGRSRPSFLGTNPRWDEHVEFSVDNIPCNLLITVQDIDDYTDKEEVYAYASIPFDPSAFRDEVTKDFYLDFRPTGRIWLRATVDLEKADTQFYFGKIFRMIQLAQSGMGRMIVQQMSNYMRDCLAFKNLLKDAPPPPRPSPPLAASRPAETGALTTTSAVAPSSSSFLGNKFRAFLGKATGSTPPVSNSGSPSSHTPTSDPVSKSSSSLPEDPVDTMSREAIHCDLVLQPLTDYLNTNLAVLFQNLHSGVSKNIVVKIWREILYIFDDLLLPPGQGPFDDDQYTVLTPGQLGIIYACLERLKLFFNGDDDPTGDVDLIDRLQSRHYYDLLKIREYYHLPTEDLVDLYVNFTKRDQMPEFAARRRDIQRRKTVWAYGNRQRRNKLNREAKKSVNDTEIVMRLLRARDTHPPPADER
ncbi:hypothetical protein H4R33_002542 [Dimargaris cristalligena]|nr:hypothetical protein H4R33_002542 [Dimargaris cristalligena]